MAIEDCCSTGEHDLIVLGDCGWCGHHVGPPDGPVTCRDGRPTCVEAMKARVRLPLLLPRLDSNQ